MTVRDIVILGTSSQQHTRLRNHGAYLVRWNEEGLLFDPGEGTQRQFIYANVAPTVVNRIFISHFHGDHCLGLGSILMRLNLDKVSHPIHCYYPKSGKVYFDRLRYGTIYHENIRVVEHPVSEDGIVEVSDNFTVEAKFLEHGNIDNIGWRIKEKDTRKFNGEKLKELGIKGEMVSLLEQRGKIEINGKIIHIDDVSYIREGDILAVIIDTQMCPQAIKLAKNSRMLLCESTYLESEADLAKEYHHLTAKQAAQLAKDANAKELILTHFSARYQKLDEFFKEAGAIFPNTHVAHDLQIFAFPKNPNKS